MNDFISEIQQYFPGKKVKPIADIRYSNEVAVCDDWTCLQYSDVLPCKNIVIRTNINDFISWSRFLRISNKFSISVYIFFLEKPQKLEEKSEVTFKYLQAVKTGAKFLNYEGS